VREHLVPVLELDTEHGVGERLDNRSFQHDRIFFGLGRVILLRLVLLRLFRMN
jgi:hypothetical protein